MDSADRTGVTILGTLASVALVAIACGPRVNPLEPSERPGDGSQDGDVNTVTSPVPVPVAKTGAGREILVGEMCPSAASGRPGVMPTIMRRISWDDDRARMGDVLERNMAKQFSVLGWDGRRVGLFSVAGAATSGGLDFAMGAYAGGSACETAGATPKPIAACEKSMLSCGLAIAVLRPSGGATAAPYEEDPEPDNFRIGGACVAKGSLVVDIDHDGTMEVFPTKRFLNPFRAPAEEVVAVVGGSASCSPSFAIRGVIAETDPRDWRGLDIIGVIDLDDDGRDELVAVYNYQDRRTWAIFSARSGAGRLELVAEGQPWPRPKSKQSQKVTDKDLDETP